jgi:hypothetical protein
LVLLKRVNVRSRRTALVQQALGNWVDRISSNVFGFDSHHKKKKRRVKREKGKPMDSKGKYTSEQTLRGGRGRG